MAGRRQAGRVAIVMSKLRHTIDCSFGFVEPNPKLVEASRGDLAVARVRDELLETRFVVGVVTEVSNKGDVRAIAISRRRPRWEYDGEVHVGPKHKIQLGSSAEQIALALPNLYRAFDDAHTAVLDFLKAEAVRQGDGETEQQGSLV